MRKVTSKQSAMAVAIGMTIFGSIANAQDAKVCSIDDGKVVCASSAADRKAVFDAMSNPKSTQYFKNLIAQPGFSLDVKRRERFRRSLERNRRAMHRYARAQFRSYRRRKIDGESYEKTVSGYKTAVATYKAAMNIYRATIWHSKNPPRF